ncbi:MAG: zf-HC2 domain-containing protein [Planctomycetota bacterium]
MDCNRILDLLPLHAGGDLAPDEAAEVDRHLETCGRCSTDLAGFRTSLQALKGEAEVAVPDRVCEELWAGVKLGLQAERKIKRPLFGSPVVRWAAAAAVFAVGLWGGIVAMRALRTQDAPPRDVVDKPQAPRESRTAVLPVPARSPSPRQFDLRSVATPVSDRGSMIEVIPAGTNAGSYQLDELRVIRDDEVSLGY